MEQAGQLTDLAHPLAESGAAALRPGKFASGLQQGLPGEAAQPFGQAKTLVLVVPREELIAAIPGKHNFDMLACRFADDGHIDQRGIRKGFI